MILRPTSTAIGPLTVRLDALPDAADFRDRVFTSTLADVPTRMELDHYLSIGVPVLTQGTDGSCAGFALATVAHYLLRTRRVDPDRTRISARMLYEMAKRYDDWPGEGYEGTTARGAIKGWHKHGVCQEALWPYGAGEEDRVLTNERAVDALTRPLGAYYRVNHKELRSMHNALAGIGVLLATLAIHPGWVRPAPDGVISLADERCGGHAVAIVGYDRRGFWVQNSWGPEWGIMGCALVTYDDWLLHGMDAWVVRLGVPVQVTSASASAHSLYGSSDTSQARLIGQMRSHIVRVGTNGRLQPTGPFATTEADVARILHEDFPTVSERWASKRLLFYAHSGLSSEAEAVRSVVDLRTRLLQEEIYPIVFLWNTDLLWALQTILDKALQRRQPHHPEQDGRGLDFMLDRQDAALEPQVRELAGRLIWNDMKEIGPRAHRNEAGAGRIVLHHLAQLTQKQPEVELHLLAHSAGSNFLAPFVQLLTGSVDDRLASGPMHGRCGLGLPVRSCILWAPAITVAEFEQTYAPAAAAERIESLTLFTLSDAAERSDSSLSVYRKSPLYLISNALEERLYISPLHAKGEALLGMERYAAEAQSLLDLIHAGRATWVIAPNGAMPRADDGSRCQNHVDFPYDDATLRSTIARIKDGMILTGVSGASRL